MINNSSNPYYTSNGIPIPNNSTYFEPLVASKIDDADLLEKYQQDGFIFIKSFFDKAYIQNIRKEYFSMFDKSMFKEGSNVGDGVFSGKFQFLPNQHGHKEHPASTFVRTPMFQELTNSASLFHLSAKLLGNKTILLPRRPIRQFYPNTNISSKAHADLTYLDRGTDNVLSVWIPLGDIPMDTGNIIYLKNSHKLDVSAIRQTFHNTTVPIVDARPITADLKALSDYTHLPWLYTNFEAGDIIVHNPLIIHATLDCCTDYMRLSTDIRFADADEAQDPRWLQDWRGDDGY